MTLFNIITTVLIVKAEEKEKEKIKPDLLKKTWAGQRGYVNPSFSTTEQNS